MEINEALNVAKQIIKGFKSLERLDEFVKEISNMQGQVKDLSAKKERLERETKDLETSKENAVVTFEAFRAERDRTNKMDIEQTSSKTTKAYQERELAEAQLGARIKELNDSISNLEKDHRKKMASFEQEENAAKGKIEKTKAEFEALKRKLE